MTRGTVLVLGTTGKNFGAGMTGGTAYVLDLRDEFLLDLNRELVTATRLVEEEDILTVKELIYKHLERTESERAKEILAQWADYQDKFWRVRPTYLPPPEKTAPEPVPTTVEAGEAKD
jgi:glutamate synthase domain-containing protein 3